MKRLILSVMAFAAIGLANGVYAAGDAAAGKAAAAGCAGCHGANGEGKDPYPALAGKSEHDLEEALEDYKSGKRKNAIMKTFASKLSDQDIANVAAYYASLKGK